MLLNKFHQIFSYPNLPLNRSIGGKRIDDQRFMDLHVLTNVSVDDVVMKEEIFGK